MALVQEALLEHQVDCDLLALSDGEKAIDYVSRIEQGEAECPALVVLDLNLPRPHGRGVLAAIRSTEKCRSVPVVVLSSSSAPGVVAEAAALGPTQYMRKPMDLDEFMGIGVTLKTLLAGSTGTGE